MTIQNAVNQMLESVGRVAGATKIIKTAKNLPTKEDIEKWSTEAQTSANNQLLTEARDMTERYTSMVNNDRSSLEGLRRLNERAETISRQRDTIQFYDRFGDIIRGGGGNG